MKMKYNNYKCTNFTFNYFYAFTKKLMIKNDKNIQKCKS